MTQAYTDACRAAFTLSARSDRSTTIATIAMRAQCECSITPLKLRLHLILCRAATCNIGLFRCLRRNQPQYVTLLTALRRVGNPLMVLNRGSTPA